MFYSMFLDVPENLWCSKLSWRIFDNLEEPLTISVARSLKIVIVLSSSLSKIYLQDCQIFIFKIVKHLFSRLSKIYFQDCQRFFKIWTCESMRLQISILGVKRVISLSRSWFKALMRASQPEIVRFGKTSSKMLKTFVNMLLLILIKFYNLKVVISLLYTWLLSSVSLQLISYWIEGFFGGLQGALHSLLSGFCCLLQRLRSRFRCCPKALLRGISRRFQPFPRRIRQPSQVLQAFLHDLSDQITICSESKLGSCWSNTEVIRIMKHWSNNEAPIQIVDPLRSLLIC